VAGDACTPPWLWDDQTGTAMSDDGPTGPMIDEVVPAAGRRTGRKWTISALLLAGAAVLWLGFGTDFGRRGDAPSEAPEFRGGVLSRPAPKPQFTLTDTEGRPFDFVQETAGQVTLLFFGFTYCPDICPVHMANVAAVLDDLPPDMRRQIRVVFISGDPDRDTPERLREWLDAFDPSFIGLRGSVEEVNAILADLRLVPLVHGPADSRGNYSVGHPAQILAFTPDGYLRLMYPFGMRQADWAHDLPKLVAWQPPGDGAGGHASLIRASMAYVPAPAGAGPAAVYVTLTNRATEPDTLLGATTRVAGYVELHRHAMTGGRMMMEQVAGAGIAAGDSLSLAPGGYHLMLFDLTAPLAPGDTFTVDLEFRRGGTLPVRAVVVPYSTLEQMLPARGTPAGQAGH
jgi:protein SCO1